MRKYEVMYIIAPNLEEAAAKEMVTRFENVVTENGGQIVNLKEMGKRRLAYEIEDFREGYYVLMNLESEPAVVKELDRLFRINEDIIRHIVINEDEK